MVYLRNMAFNSHNFVEICYFRYLTFKPMMHFDSRLHAGPQILLYTLIPLQNISVIINMGEGNAYETNTKGKVILSAFI